MKFGISQTLEYSVIFNEAKPSALDMIKGIPSKLILEIFSWLGSEIYGKEQNIQVQITLLQKLSGRFPIETKAQIFGNVDKLIKAGKSFNVVNNVSNLSIIQFALLNYEEGEPRDLTPQEELNLFKAYLILSEEWTTKPQFGKIKEPVKSKEEFLEFFIPVQLPNGELFELKDFIIQYIKAVYFFQFISEDDFFKPLYEAFLKENSIGNWREYFNHLFSSFIGGYNKKNVPSFKLLVKDEFQVFKDWLSRFCIDVEKVKESDDFLSIRDKPMFKLNHDDFLFLNHNFIIDKIFQGIIFDLVTAARNHNVTLGKVKVKSFTDLKPLYSEIFSEKIMLYNLIEFLYSKKSSLRFTGDEINKEIGDGEVDYFIRDGSNLILIEFKDVLFSAKAKSSYDYATITEELKLKMIENQKGAPKGITQIINSIRDISEGRYNFDISKPEKMKIYPVIIFTDFTFNLIGFNYLLNQEFKSRISKESLSVKKIYDLTLIHIDTLIKFQDLFQEKKLNLKNLIEEYITYVNVKKPKGVNGYMKQFASFDTFLHNKTAKMGYDIPKVFREEIFKIIKKENDEEQSAKQQ